MFTNGFDFAQQFLVLLFDCFVAIVHEFGLHLAAFVEKAEQIVGGSPEHGPHAGPVAEVEVQLPHDTEEHAVTFLHKAQLLINHHTRT